MIKTRFDILVELYPENGWIINNYGIQNLDNVEIDENKVNEILAAEPMRLLREKRDRLIASTDWWVLPDRSPTQAQLQYREALRDLPANSPNAALDENGNLINVEWPEIPA